MKTLVKTYGVTVLAVVIATVVRWVLNPLLGSEAPFSTFIIAVVFVAWWQGFWETVLAIALGFVAAAVFFVPLPLSLFEISVPAFSRFGMYLLICGAIATFGENARRAQRSTQDARDLAEQRAEMLRITFASIGDAVITTDGLGNVSYLNSVAETLTGWASSEASGQPLQTVFQIVNEASRQAVHNPAFKALKLGVIVGLANHTVLIAKDGVEHPIDDSAAPIFNKNGEIVGCVLVFRDVTERKQQQKQLEDALSRLESTLVAGEIGTWEFDISQNAVRADQNLARMFGVSSQDASGGPLEAFTRVIHPDDHPRVAESIGRAIESGTNFESEYRVIDSNQSIRWVIARGRIERDATGKAVRLPGVVVDITQQRMAEERLRASEERRRQALDSAELGAWHLDPATMSLSTDERFRAIFGVKDGHLPYEAAVALIHEEDRPRVQQAVDAATRAVNPLPYEVDYRVILPNGELRWVFAKGRANYSQRGTVRQLVSFDGTVADITERKRMENDLRQLAADLSEADHRKDEFLATLAHELRNPLAPIRSGLEVMRLAGRDPGSVEQARRMMERQLTQLVRLVDDLMDVSRISQGKLELRTEPLDLATVIHSAIETSKGLIDEMGHQLIVELSSQPVIVQADLTRLAQVFMNLVNNSAKYSNCGSRIWITTTLRERDVVVTVQDEGIGIAPDHLPIVFDLFSQIEHSLTKAQGGLGIGLSLVKRLVEMHGGHVEARSEGTGKGSQFSVTLPLLTKKPDIEVPTADNGSITSTTLRILVVDDNRDGADSLSMMLTFLGNQIRTAYDGAEAVVAAEEFQPNVILLDIGLPKLNGYEACARIRALPGGKDVIIIALTGWGADEDRNRTRAAGFNHHIVKPVDPQLLMKMLAEIP
ncbi:hybrid sensor histidine kinase/response regulator [Schlesneria paludicola]|uniref:hybrid sensor histidine kinase/response regulator n=1 Tax=Schlesneria paludicola TaxID=360056 RepID=UPI000299E23F|nr:PAS domain-containing protein [Schlesneria paludicola]